MINANHQFAKNEEEKSSKKKLQSFYNPMCFIDIEMTDPDPYKANIVEIAAYLVNGDLTEKYLIADFVINQPDVSIV
jgi:oligoribonuclease (3'-5' exoribonuclease)